MNKRIKKLISESYVEIPHEREWDATESVFSEQKFAELIVLECCKFTQEKYTRDFDALWRDDFVNQIKKHFGVK